MSHLVSSEDMKVFEVGPAGSHARILNGAQHDLPSVSLMLAEIQPAEGVPLHRHRYDELFVVHEGQATFTIGDEIVVASPGQVVLVRAGVAHGFTNTGTGVLRQTAIHVAPEVVIEWLDPPPRPGVRE